MQTSKSVFYLFSWHRINPLNSKIKIQILIHCPLHISHRSRGGGGLLNFIFKFIFCDPVLNSRDHSVFKKCWYFKEKVDADHSQTLKG